MKNTPVPAQSPYLSFYMGSWSQVTTSSETHEEYACTSSIGQRAGRRGDTADMISQKNTSR